MATLVKNGRYFSLQFYSPNRTPARKRISLRVEKKRDALRLKSLLESRYACGEIDPWVSTLRPPYWGREALRVTKQVTVQEGFLEFLESREGCREATILHYRWILSLFSRFVGPETDINDLSSASVLSWLGTSTTNTHTRYTYYSRLKVAFRYLVKIGRLNSNPCELVVVSKPSENLSAKCVSEEQLAKIVEYASDSDTPYLADVAIVTFDLALRLGEICALKGSWLEEDCRWIVVRSDLHFQTKSGREVAKPVSDRAAEIFKRLQSTVGPNDRLFRNTKGRPLSPKHTSKQFKKIVRALYLPEEITFHGLRHGGISAAIRRGASIEAVRRFAGHSSFAVTQNYIHLQKNDYLNQILVGRSSSE